MSIRFIINSISEVLQQCSNYGKPVSWPEEVLEKYGQEVGEDNTSSANIIGIVYYITEGRL